MKAEFVFIGLIVFGAICLTIRARIIQVQGDTYKNDGVTSFWGGLGFWSLFFGIGPLFLMLAE